MAELVVKPVETRRERKQFLKLPWSIFQDDPNWVPPLRTNQKELVGYKPHPFHDLADMQTFLAVRDGQPVGRIAAFINHAHNKKYQEQLGFFGFFDCPDDQQVAHGLFDAAREWLAERDTVALRGPCNPSLNYEIGLLIDGFDSPPMFMMTYNHPYYQQLIESYGFEKSQDMYAFWGHIDMLDKLDDKLAFVVEEATRRFDIKLREMNRKNFEQEVRTYLDIYNRSLEGTWGFVPLSQGEVDHFAKGLKELIVPEMTCVAEVDGKPIAAVFALLDYNPIIKEIDGRLFPFGFIKLLTKRKKIKAIRAIATTVVPEFQRWGVGLVVLGGLIPKAKEWGIEECEFSWVLESNTLSRKTLQKGGAKLTKTYRLYDLDYEKAKG